MAATQAVTSLQSLQQAASSAITAEKPGENLVDVRLAIHDTSRLEWAASVAMPKRGKVDYTIEVDLEIPTHVLPAHSPWNQLQELARLDGPDDSAPSVATIDGVRRFAVGVAAKLSRASEGFGRHARLAISPFETNDVPSHINALEGWILTAERTLHDARDRLSRVMVEGDVKREALLADEYLSLRLLELLAGVESALAKLFEQLPDASVLITNAGETVADVLTREMEQRASVGYPEADPDSPQGLEQYLDRASRLKKHFQEVLFLDAERFAVSERLHHWVAGAVAIVASTWAFIGQIYLTRGGSLSTRLSSSIVMACVFLGVVYAVKDRIKEVGRNWFAANVHRFYAQRIARYRAPAKTCPSRDVIVRAKESFVTKNAACPDPLNPTSGATLPITTLSYRHVGTLEASRTLSAAGISRVKHVFRYDLSPLFARLDDATKPVPIFDAKARRVRFAQAPRCYRVPVRVVVTRGDVCTSQRGAVIVHKRGLERIELY